MTMTYLIIGGIVAGFLAIGIISQARKEKAIGKTRVGVAGIGEKDEEEDYYYGEYLTWYSNDGKVIEVFEKCHTEFQDEYIEIEFEGERGDVYLPKDSLWKIEIK